MIIDLKSMTIKELAVYIEGLEEIQPELEKALLDDGRSGAALLLEKNKRRHEKVKKENDRLNRMLNYEKKLWEEGFTRVAGVDEAGRGPLAGPVVAAAVILTPGTLIKGLNDSKQLSPAKRDHLFEEIIIKALAYGLGSASTEEIDRVNIHRAALLAMQRAIKMLSREPDFVLIDGFQLPGLSCPQKGIKGGDARSLSIAAASVLAKVSRDKLMLKLHKQHPQYGFNRNMGYGTEEHRMALEEHGPCPFHRRSFRLGCE